MTKDDARRLILAKWPSWAAANATGKSKPNGMNGLMFFSDLQRNDGHLLNFRDRGDKWQTVHGWLLRAGLVSD
jgi:hypothetical protein